MIPEYPTNGYFANDPSDKACYGRCMRGLVFILLWVVLSASLAPAADEYVMLKGLAYGPFRDGQRPGGAYPTEAQIRSDLELIRRIAPKIRTYGVENILGDIPGFCEDIGLDCYPGAWLDGDFSSNNQQLAALLDIAAESNSTTKAFIVGNETLLRGDLTPAQLAGYLNSIKNLTGVPVTTADAFWYFLDPNYDAVAEACDFLTVHIHPWWYDFHITNAAAVVAEAYSLVTDRWPTKPVIIGEVGWTCVLRSTGRQDQWGSTCTAAHTIR